MCFSTADLAAGFLPWLHGMLPWQLAQTGDAKYHSVVSINKESVSPQKRKARKDNYYRNNPYLVDCRSELAPA
jgi:hypothetical protein